MEQHGRLVGDVAVMQIQRLPPVSLVTTLDLQIWTQIFHDKNSNEHHPNWMKHIQGHSLWDTTKSGFEFAARQFEQAARDQTDMAVAQTTAQTLVNMMADLLIEQTAEHHVCMEKENREHHVCMEKENREHHCAPKSDGDETAPR